MESQSQLKSSAFDRLALKLIKYLNAKEHKELVLLYKLAGCPQEDYEILEALQKANKLCLNKDCLELFIENMKTINFHGTQEFIKEAEKLLEACKGAIKRQDPLPFQTRVSPPQDNVEVEPLAQNFKAVREQSQVSIGETSHLVTGKLISINDMTWQKKRPRSDIQRPVIQECDSTYNSEESSTDGDDGHGDSDNVIRSEASSLPDDNQSQELTDDTLSDEDHMPPVAAGDDLKYMRRTVEVAHQSEDPHTKVGAVLVSPDGRIIGEGYNLLPREGLSWDRNADNEENTKYPYVTHAAMEAIQNAYKAKESLEGATLYTNLYPSSRDGVTILRAGVKEVVFLDTKREWRKRYRTGATKRLFDGIIACRQISLPEDD